MKVAVTGHYSGLGKELFELFPNSIGFDLENGFDIKNLDHLNNIVYQAKDCDVFINNAYNNVGQINLLQLFFDIWRFTDKTIVTIGSAASDHTNLKYDDFGLYPAHKKALEMACEILNNTNRNCKVLFFKLDKIKDHKEIANNIKDVIIKETKGTTYGNN